MVVYKSRGIRFTPVIIATLPKDAVYSMVERIK